MPAAQKEMIVCDSAIGGGGEKERDRILLVGDLLSQPMFVVPPVPHHMFFILLLGCDMSRCLFLSRESE